MSSLISTHATAVAKKAFKQNKTPWQILSTEYNKCLTRKQKSGINSAAKVILKGQNINDSGAEKNQFRHEKTLGEDF